MNETGIIICVALCMFFEGELVEHTYKSSMSECLKAKRIAERNAGDQVQYTCTLENCEMSIDKMGVKHCEKIIK